MSLDARELIAALPIDIDETQELSQQTLEGLLSSLAQMPVPVSRLTRLWALGSMQAKIAVAYFAYWIRSGYAASDEKERLLNETRRYFSDHANVPTDDFNSVVALIESQLNVSLTRLLRAKT